MQDKPKLAAAHGLRGLAAFSVVVNHLIGWSAPGREVAWYFLPLTYIANQAVPTFIVLSGFVLALPVVHDTTLRGGVFGFLTRRALRILPAYYLALVLSFLAAVYVTHTASLGLIMARDSTTIGPLFLLNDVYGSTPYDVPLWSLPIEWHIYFAFPLFVLAWRRFGVARAMLGGVALVCAAFVPARALGIAGVAPQFYALFLVGVAAAYVVHARTSVAAQLRVLRIWTPTAIGGTALFGIYFLAIGYPAYLAVQPVHQLVWGVIAFCLLLSLAITPSRLRRVLESRPIQGLGTISYSLYLLHWIPASIMGTWLAAMPVTQPWPPLARFAVLLATVVPASLLLAAASYHLAERPFLLRKAGNHRSGQMPIAAPARV